MDDILVSPGGAAKSLDERQYLVLFSGPNDPDASTFRNFFTKSTDFGFAGRGEIQTAIYYDHGKNPTLKKTVIGHGTLGMDDLGVWIEGELDKRNRYVRGVKKLLDKGALGWSSGTAVHLIETKSADFKGEVLKWPLGLDASLTPTPAEPRTRAVGLKSLSALESEDLDALLERNGVEIEPDAATKDIDGAGPHDGLTLQDDTTRALDAARGVNARWREIAEANASDPAVKVGAKLTKSRRERLTAWRDGLMTTVAEVDELLAETEPPPPAEKAEPEPPAEPDASKEAPPAESAPTTASLRTQSLRLASQAAVLLH